MFRNGRSHWSRSLRCGSAVAGFLRLQVRIPLAAWMSYVSCQVSVTGRSLSQRSLIEFVRACVCLCVSLSVNRCNNKPLHLKRVGRRGQNKKERKKEVVLNKMLYRHCFSTLLYNVPLGRSSKQEGTANEWDTHNFGVR